MYQTSVMAPVILTMIGSVRLDGKTVSLGTGDGRLEQAIPMRMMIKSELDMKAIVSGGVYWIP